MSYLSHSARHNRARKPKTHLNFRQPTSGYISLGQATSANFDPPLFFGGRNQESSSTQFSRSRAVTPGHAVFRKKHCLFFYAPQAKPVRKPSRHRSHPSHPFHPSHPRLSGAHLCVSVPLWQNIRKSRVANRLQAAANQKFYDSQTIPARHLAAFLASIAYRKL